MTESNLRSVVDQLRQEEDRLNKKQVELRDELQAVEAEIKRVRPALTALGERTNSRATAKPAATKRDGIQVTVEILTDQGVVEKEALKDEKFVDRPAGYRMVGDVEFGKEPAAEKVPSFAASS